MGRKSNHFRTLRILLTVLVAAALAASLIATETYAADTKVILSTADTKISENAPNTNYGVATSIGADGSDPNGTGKDKSALIKWDLSGIAPGTKVSAASITLTVTRSSPQTYQAYKLKQPWSESAATWNVYGIGKPWGVAGATGLLDRDTTVAGTLTPSATGTQTFAITPTILQGWVDDPTSNQGIIIANTTNKEGFDFYSRESANSTQRPKLSVSLEPTIAPPPPETSACDEWASPFGSNTNTGSEISPFATAEKLANSLPPGQTGCLKSGTYTESDSTVSVSAGGTSTSRITLMADPNATSKPLVNARLSVQTTADYYTIKGIEWDGSYSPACGSGASCTILPGFTWNGDYGEIIDNDIHSRSPGAESTKAGICINAGTSGNTIYGLLIRSNRIHHCGRLPSSNHDHGVYLDHTRGAVVKDNTIYENADRGIQLYPDADNSEIYNNVIDRNGEGVIFSGDASYTADNNEVRNNVISNSKLRWLIEDYWGGAVGTGNTAHDNCVWPTNSNSSYNQNSGVQPGASGFTEYGKIQADPLYVGPPNDYRVDTTSGCRSVYSGA